MPVQPIATKLYQNTIIVGGFVEKDGKYLLIQEAQAKCRGKWFLEAGHLDPGETIFEGAKREIREECGCDVELTGICFLHHLPERNFLGIYFTTKLLCEQVCSLDPEEILDARWFTYEEICAMRDRGELRVAEVVLGAIDNARKGLIAPLELVSFVDGRPSQPEI